MRRYGPIAASRGTVIPAEIRAAVYLRDGGCVGLRAGLPAPCTVSGLELDHVRASHAMGMKSETSITNLVVLCGGHHRWKTEHGREARPLLIAYIVKAESRRAVIG